MRERFSELRHTILISCTTPVNCDSKARNSFTKFATRIRIYTRVMTRVSSLSKSLKPRARIRREDPYNNDNNDNNNNYTIPENRLYAMYAQRSHLRLTLYALNIRMYGVYFIRANTLRARALYTRILSSGNSAKRDLVAYVYEPFLN